MEPKGPRELGPWHQPVLSFDPGPPLSNTHNFGWVAQCSASSSNKWGGEVPPHSSNGQKKGNSERARTPSPEQRQRSGRGTQSGQAFARLLSEPAQCPAYSRRSVRTCQIHGWWNDRMGNQKQDSALFAHRAQVLTGDRHTVSAQ